MLHETIWFWVSKWNKIELRFIDSDMDNADRRFFTLLLFNFARSIEIKKGKNRRNSKRNTNSKIKPWKLFNRAFDLELKAKSAQREWKKHFFSFFLNFSNLKTNKKLKTDRHSRSLHKLLIVDLWKLQFYLLTVSSGWQISSSFSVSLIRNTTSGYARRGGAPKTSGGLGDLSTITFSIWGCWFLKLG